MLPPSRATLALLWRVSMCSTALLTLSFADSIPLSIGQNLTNSWCGKYIFVHSTDAHVWIVSCQQRVCELRHIFAGNKAYLRRAKMTRWWNRLASYGNSAMTEMERVSLSALAIMHAI